jgi:hypothetical protein
MYGVFESAKEEVDRRRAHGAYKEIHVSQSW